MWLQYIQNKLHSGIQDKHVLDIVSTMQHHPGILVTFLT